MESFGAGIKRRCIFDVLKEQQGGHREEEIELRLGLGAGTDDDMKMEQLASSSSVVLCSNTSIPHRSPPGLWFSLRPSANRKGEVLPHLPKAFIRVKNEKVTVFMVKTYLVTKLGLSNEAEVEISCMGQNLMHTLTLKHVRDAIWLPGLIQFLKSKTEFIKSSQGASVNYLMSLDYSRTCL
ncbi:E3 ubiquitin protein ligase DRIP1-like [Solanum dulcamara]|uniref:E3 ubiquitin protein ligase DRIP1-like n=1 Tax=Solanum dulcamara TaxID=45834 RepID=UPI0024851052|nr:E3 ubiquitin protein ligase DRIP1-like [Solanum dulcamara]